MGGYGRNYVPGGMLGTIGQNWQYAPLGGFAFRQSDYHRMEARAFMNSRQSYPQDALRPVPDSYFTGLAMYQGDRLAYAEEMRRARPIIVQWSEWERQTRMEA